MTNEMLDLATIQLQRGAHNAASGKFCVMELASFLAHEPFSDAPQCASPAIAAFLRGWNDALDDTDRQQLKPYAMRVIGSRGTPEQEHLRSLLALDWLIRVYTPTWLRLPGNPVLAAHAAILAALPPLTAPSTDYAAVGVQVRAAEEAAWVAARTAAWVAGAAARTAARTAAGTAAWEAAEEASQRCRRGGRRGGRLGCRQDCRLGCRRGGCRGCRGCRRGGARADRADATGVRARAG